MKSTDDTQPHTTNSVIMVRPIDFCFNEQTGLDNEFQNRPNINEQKIVSKNANIEFEKTAECLQKHGVETLILEKNHTEQCLPDAIFPNNWFSTRANGQIIIYPMKTVNRQAEVQVSQLEELLSHAGYKIQEICDLRMINTSSGILDGAILEGTGSLIFHHPSNHLFAALSERCQHSALTMFAEKVDYSLIQFQTLSHLGSPIYHTNVLMSCGEDFAVLTEEVISSSERKKVTTALSECINDLIIITEQQMSENFCGNILQLMDRNQQPVIAMSQSAYDGFTSAQRKILEHHGSLAVCAIPTIEKVGGGSVRCMLAENFLCI